MGPDASKHVAILQGNVTVAHLMREFLEDSLYTVESLRGAPPGAARARVVIVDVDSGVDAADQWIRHCDGRQLPVIICGVERSRSAYSDRPWLSRPFTAEQLVARCHEVTTGGVLVREDEEIPPPIEVDLDPRDQPTLEIPTDVSAEAIEGAPSSQKKPTTRQTAEELLDVLQIDGTGSMILEIEDLNEGDRAGGILVNKGERRAFRSEELVDDDPWSNAPDTAVDVSEKSASDAISASMRSARGATPSGKAEVTAISSFGDVASGDFSSAHRVASLVAEHWDRLGLTARPTDRADRLQRVLTAMFRDGMEGVLDELKRIPRVHGFSGRLETLPVVDLLHTIRDRRLRGRLEIGLSGNSFVLYIEGTMLQDIDTLGENTDGVLIESLRELGTIGDEEYRQYSRLREKYRGEPLEMKLRSEGIVEAGELLAAKRLRARRLLTRMCRGESGTFAFIDVPHNSGQVWPTKGLNLNVDVLLLEILREGSIAAGKESPITRSELVVDAERTAQLAPEELTESERRTIDFFEDGQSVASAQEMLGDAEEPVEEVVERLKRLELLRRLGEESEGDDKGSSSATSSGADQEERPTAVKSSWSLQILDEIADSTEDKTEDGTNPEVWPEPTEAGPEEETHEDVGFLAGAPDDVSHVDRAAQRPKKGRDGSASEDES